LDRSARDLDRDPKSDRDPKFFFDHDPTLDRVQNFILDRGLTLDRDPKKILDRDQNYFLDRDLDPTATYNTNNCRQLSV